MRLSPHFTMEEMIVSQTAARLGINNVPSPEVHARLIFTAHRMEMLREALGGHPIIVSSGYRSPELNALVKGSATSAHMRGNAVDFICPAVGRPVEVARKISESVMRIDYDQLILEYSWVHIAFESPYRHQALTFRDGHYSVGIMA